MQRCKGGNSEWTAGHKDTEVKYTESPKYQCLEFLRKNSVELYLAYCGREICEAGHTYGPAVRQEYLLHYVISGKGTFTADGKTTELGAHDAFLIMPEETTVYRADAKEPWSYVWAGFLTASGRMNAWNMPVFLLSRESVILSRRKH